MTAAAIITKREDHATHYFQKELDNKEVCEVGLPGGPDTALPDNDSGISDSAVEEDLPQPTAGSAGGDDRHNLHRHHTTSPSPPPEDTGDARSSTPRSPASPSAASSASASSSSSAPPSPLSPGSGGGGGGGSRSAASPVSEASPIASVSTPRSPQGNAGAANSPAVPMGSSGGHSDEESESDSAKREAVVPPHQPCVPTPPSGPRPRAGGGGAVSPSASPTASGAKLDRISSANDELMRQLDDLRSVLASLSAEATGGGGGGGGGQHRTASRSPPRGANGGRAGGYVAAGAAGAATGSPKNRGGGVSHRGYGTPTPHSLDAALEKQTQWYRKENEALALRLQRIAGGSPTAGSGSEAEDTPHEHLLKVLRRRTDALKEARAEHRRLENAVKNATKSLEKSDKMDAILQRARNARKSDEELYRKRVSQMCTQRQRYELLLVATSRELEVASGAAAGTPELPNPKAVAEILAGIAGCEKRIEAAAYQLSIVKKASSSEKEKIRRQIRDRKAEVGALQVEQQKLTSVLLRKKDMMVDMAQRARTYNQPSVHSTPKRGSSGGSTPHGPLQPLQSTSRIAANGGSMPQKRPLHSAAPAGASPCASVSCDDIPSRPSTPPSPPMHKSPEPLSDGTPSPSHGDHYATPPPRYCGGGGSRSEATAPEALRRVQPAGLKDDGESRGGEGGGGGDVADSDSGSSAPPTEEDFDAEEVARRPSQCV